MNHEFIPNPNNTEDKCIECGYPESKHGNNAVCDCCEKTGNLQIFGNGKRQMLLTRECMEREKAILEIDIAIHENARESGVNPFGVSHDAEGRVNQYHAIVGPYETLIRKSREFDEQLHLASDIFTARSVGIEEIRQAIWNDESIPNDQKFFKFVEFCQNRIKHLQSVIFDLNKAKIDAYSEQKAWHVSMYQFAHHLRIEEREKLKLQDITYTPQVIKEVKKPKPINVRKNKATKEEIRNAVKELNEELKGIAKTEIPEFMVQMMMTSKNMDLDGAINHLRKQIKEGLSESN